MLGIVTRGRQQVRGWNYDRKIIEARHENVIRDYHDLAFRLPDVSPLVAVSVVALILGLS
jgi:hypothetical protein